MIRRYVSKPQPVDAVKWTGDNLDDLIALAGEEKVTWDVPRDGVSILAGQDGGTGWLPLPLHTYAVRWADDQSDIWPMDPQRFESKYMPQEPEEAE